MSTLYLTNLDSDVAGYKLALVDERNPSPPSSVATAVTDTTASGADIPMTITAGGTALSFITKPLAVAITINSIPYYNFWVKESNTAANAGISVRFYKYTGGAQGSTLLTSDYGTEALTTIANDQWVGAAAISSTSFAIGDRIVITPYVDNVGTMGASQTFTMDYDGAAADADGDTYMLIQELVRVNEVQVGNGTTPTVKGIGVSWAWDRREGLQTAVDIGFIASNATVQSAIDDFNALAQIL